MVSDIYIIYYATMAPIGWDYNGISVQIEVDTPEKAQKNLENLTAQDAEHIRKVLDAKFPVWTPHQETDKHLSNKYPSHKWYSALYEQYGKDERYKEFFSKLKIEGNDIILDHKKFALLTAEHNGKDIFLGDFEKNGQKGITGLTYMTGKAGMEQAKKQNKKLFKTGEEADAFINQFPWESTKDKIFAFVNLFGLQKSGFWTPHSKEWSNVGSVGYATLSEVYENGTVREVRWTGDGAHIEWTNQRYPQPVVAFEDC